MQILFVKQNGRASFGWNLFTHFPFFLFVFTQKVNDNKIDYRELYLSSAMSSLNTIDIRIIIAVIEPEVLFDLKPMTTANLQKEKTI